MTFPSYRRERAIFFNSATASYRRAIYTRYSHVTLHNNANETDARPDDAFEWERPCKSRRVAFAKSNRALSLQTIGRQSTENSLLLIDMPWFPERVVGFISRLVCTEFLNRTFYSPCCVALPPSLYPSP